MIKPNFYCKNFIEKHSNLPKYQVKDCKEQCHNCMDIIIEHHFNKTKTTAELSYRETFGLPLPPPGTIVEIYYLEGCNYSISWPQCPDGENVLYGWLSKAECLKKVDHHKWILNK
jgi:hypothetical protein